MTRNKLKIVAGCLWAGIGMMLAARGGRWMLDMYNHYVMGNAEGTHSSTLLVVYLALGLLVGAAKGKFVLSKSAARNIARIDLMKEPVAIWHVFPLKLLPLIAVMIGMGYGLRMLAEKQIFLSWASVGAIYIGIGAALFFSSLSYFSLRQRVPLNNPDVEAMVNASDDNLKKKAVEPLIQLGSPRAIDGVLLINLGTPRSYMREDVKAYLKEFLGDPRVIQVPRLFWWPILNFMILPFRSGKSAALYKSVWTDNGSPLKVMMEKLTEKMQNKLGDLKVAWAFRYGENPIVEQLQKLKDQGCQSIRILPLFPQFSYTTTESVMDKVKVFHKKNPDMHLEVIQNYGFDDRTQEAWAAQLKSQKTDNHLVLFSFHGLPEKYVIKGDPYEVQCYLQARAVAEKAGLKQWLVCFQSKFGDGYWLIPSTEDTLVTCAEAGQKVLVTTPGFSMDCLETIEEIDGELKDIFTSFGGKALKRVPCLNDSSRAVDLYTELLR